MIYCPLHPRSIKGLRQPEVARFLPRRGASAAGANSAGEVACRHGLRNAFFGLGAGEMTRKMGQHSYLGLWNLRRKRNGQEVSSP